MTYEDRPAYRKRRMAELLAETEENVNRTRTAKARPAAAADPVVEVKRGGWWNDVLGVVILLALSFLLTGAAMTIGRFTGHDFADARRTGTATVEQCERRGPVSLKGFGYWKQCTVTIEWNGGPSSRVLIGKPGFFKGDKQGDIFQIGEHTGSRGSIGYSRPELPERGWVTAIGLGLGLIGVLPAIAGFYALRESIKDLFRRHRG
ncbi:MAG: hypothetical protein QOH97_1762 [Actinoplanes sp.]|jgi:hypothetical protein|nr:hypothetical protein [Actinoplanes sp.]